MDAAERKALQKQYWDALEAIQIVGMASRFLMPFAMAGNRWPEGDEVEAEVAKIAAVGVSAASLEMFRNIVGDVTIEAAKIRFGTGNA